MLNRPKITNSIAMTFKQLPLLAAMILVLASSTFAKDNLAKPTPEQVAWADTEIGMFIHFGPATWQDVEEDNLSTPLDQINPEKLDTDQWVQVARDMGAKYVVFVAKHSGGFCSWQTDTTDYSIKHTPWRNGKGDVLADLSASCKKKGLKLGVYISPADHKHHINAGGKAENAEEQKEYDKIYRQQLTEILSNYGEMFEVWFDGSTGTAVTDIIQKHAPHAMVFQGPAATIRWVGNEDGTAPYPAWNALPMALARTGKATAKAGDPDGDAWMPNECDTEMTKYWHWKTNGSETLKSLDTLMDTYNKSVGRGAVLLLNQSPDRTGLIPAADAKRGKEFGDEVRRRFAKSLGDATGKGDVVELDLGKPTILDTLVTMEDIAQGERVREYTIEGLAGDKWIELAKGTAIGHKKIDALPKPIEVSKLRLNITKSAAEPQIRKLSAYNTAR